MAVLLPTLRRRGMFERPAWRVYDPFIEDFRWPSVFTEETEWMPPFDVSETDDEMIVRLEVPGMDKKDININLSYGTLTVTGEKSRKKKGMRPITAQSDATGLFPGAYLFPLRWTVTRWMRASRTEC